MTIPTGMIPPHLRDLFPVCQHGVYLNNAAVAPPSLPVQRAIDTWMQDVMHHGIRRESGWEQEADRVRALAAQLIGATPAEIAFVRNTSHGLGLVAEGLPWREGDEVAVCTAIEYPSNVYPWQHLASRGVRVRDIAPSDGGVSVEAVEQALTPRTRLVSVSAVQFASGHRTDVQALGTLCRERGVWLCVDGIQQVGATPLNVREAGIHFMSADSHKWMLGLSGIGFLYVAQEVLEELRPVLVGWHSTTDAFNFDEARFELRPDAAKLEEGSPAYPLIYGLGAALDLLLEVGVPTVAEHISRLHRRIEQELAQRFEVGPHPNARAGILTLAPRQHQVAELAARCEEAGISLSLRRGRLRVSPHFYNNNTDVDRLLEVLLEGTRS